MKTQVWEEKNSIELSAKSVSRPIFDPNNGINGTKNKFVKRGCNDIGSKKKWKRNCPKCHEDIFHVEKWTRDRFQQEKRTCGSCRKRIDVSGQIFGYLTALHYTKKNHDGNSFWMFKCVCGNKVEKNLANVKKGRGDHCGCKNKSKISAQSKMPDYAWIYKNLVWNGNRRKIKVLLTLDEFLVFPQITSCHYCKSTVNWAKRSPDCGIIKNNHGYHLDRKNTNQPYSKENCVVCCGRCNYGKSNKFSYDEWYGMTRYFREKS